MLNKKLANLLRFYDPISAYLKILRLLISSNIINSPPLFTNTLSQENNVGEILPPLLKRGLNYDNLIVCLN